MLNYKITCRTCLAETIDLTPITNEIVLENTPLNLREILEKCTNLKILPDDNLPQKMCMSCVIKLSKAYSFHLQCWESNAILSSQFIQIEEILIDEDVKEGAFDEIDNINVIDYNYNTDDNFPDEESQEPVACESSSTQDEDISKDSTTKPDKTNRTSKKETLCLCPACGKEFKKTTLLNAHMKLHDPENNLKCEFCQRPFSAASLLKKHLRSHTGEQPFSCEICGKRTTTKFDLKVHMRFHTGERPFQCDFCGKTFMTSSHRAEHVREHTNLNPIECEICHKQFKKTSRLRNHSKVHDVAKHLPCLLCDKKFPFKKNLDIHMRKHRGEKPFSCKICGKTFTVNYNLKIHCMSQHGLNE